ncbi:hypothetical protein [Cetobacterium sp.]|uniref:hypothetical protein n=1 Tax=Cetobacterium sp. TaxID=2071632 RepID=UPI003F3F31D6
MSFNDRLPKAWKQIKKNTSDITTKLDKTGKATDSDKLDGHDSTYFATKSSSDKNASDITGKVSKVGDTMTGTLIVKTGKTGGEVALQTTSSAQISLKDIDGKAGIRVGGSGGNENKLHFWGAGDNLFGIWDTGNLNINGTATAKKFLGALQGNADSATKLATQRTINGLSFDGTANITTSNWGTARNLQIGNTANL